LNTKKIITFISFSYGISWLIWLPNVVCHNFNVGWQHSNWLHLLGGLGPLFGALITTFIFDKKIGLKKYFQNKLFSLPKPIWLIIGIGMPLLFFLIPYFYFGISKAEWLNFSVLGLNSKLPFSNPVAIWLLWCFTYGLGEEGGWRGFLLHEFSQKYSVRLSTIIVSFIWATWHLPVFFYDKDLSQMGVGGIIGWTVGLMFGSLLLGWLLVQSGWKLWPVILWHATFNFFTTSDQLSYSYQAFMSTLVMVVTLILVIVYDKNFKRNSTKNTAIKL